MSGPAVSVVVPVRNAARFLREALDSIAANAYAPIEILVVDGHSTDASADIARLSSHVRWMLQAGSGLADAWNTGLDAARGELIAFLDADDVWVAGSLAARAAYLEAHLEAPAVVGLAAFFAEPGVSIARRFGRADLETPHVAYLPSALLARRQLFDAVGRFDTNLAIAADVDWFARVKDSGQAIGTLHQLVVKKRVHNGNLSVADVDRTHRELLAVLRRSIRRQSP